MKTVTVEIEGAEKAPQELEFLTWKNDGNGFYARPLKGKPVVVRLTPVWPEPKGEKYIGEVRNQKLPEGWQEIAYGRDWELPPVRILPCWLVPPPFRETRAEWEAIGESLAPFPREAMRVSVPIPSSDQGGVEYTPLEPWEVRFLQTGRSPLYLTPEEDEHLEALIEKGGKGTRKILEGAIKERFEQWAKTERVDGVAMERWRRELFRKFAPNFLNDEDPLFRMLCASVVYRIEWKDAAAYLLKCSIADNLLPKEWKELRDCGFETVESGGPFFEQKSEQRELPLVNNLGEGRSHGWFMVKRKILRHMYDAEGNKSYLFQEDAKNKGKQFRPRVDGEKKMALYDARDWGFEEKDVTEAKKDA